MLYNFKKLAIFVHWDQDNIIDDYVVKYMRELQLIAKDIVFVSNSNISQKEQSKLSQLVDHIIIRENIGYDFMAWRDGLRYIEYKNLSQYDEVIIANDSCYAPLHPFSEMFDVMEKKDCDFWGITETYTYKYSLNSYFVVFRKTVLRSVCFKNFWEIIKIEKYKSDVITKYEVGLTQILLENHFKKECYIKLNILQLILSSLKYKFLRIKNILISYFYKKNKVINFGTMTGKYSKWNKLKAFLNPFNTNVSLTDINILLKYKAPIIKVMLLRDNPFRLNCIKNNQWKVLLKKHTNYNIDLIENHLNRIKKRKNS